MKLAILLTFVGVLNATASAYSQTGKLTMNMENASIVDVLNHIERSTDYHFIYSLELVANKRLVSVHADKEPIKNILRDILTPNGADYKVLPNNLIVVTPKKGMAPLAPMAKTFKAIQVQGTVTDVQGATLTGVTVQVKSAPSIGTVTDGNGHFTLNVPNADDTLLFSYIGYEDTAVALNGRSNITVTLALSSNRLEEAVVVGYGTQKKKEITGAISSVTSEELGNIHAGATVSNILAGQVAGLSFRKAEGRPGSDASIQIRNMGDPLFVIDGVIEDAAQFNNLAPSDIQSISVLKGAQAAIYGSRAANGVVVVTTKQGHLNTPTKIGIDAYYGWQNLTAFPKNVLTSAWKWKRYAAEAQLNATGNTTITPEEIEKWKHPEDQKYPVQYQSFDWPDFIYQENAPQSSIHAYASGGSDKTNYYLSFTRLDQDAVYYQYNFNRTNMQANITTRIGDDLTVGFNGNGRVEERIRPGVPGVDDYGQPLIAAMRNLPTEHPYANNNPEYLNTLGNHDQTNAAYWNFEDAGKWQSDWRVLQSNLHIIYDLPVDGLSIKGQFSYYYGHQFVRNHEFTYKTYTYDPTTDKYNQTGGSSNPWQERGNRNVIRVRRQLQAKYDNSFGKHSVAATVGTQWKNSEERYQHIHNVPPVNQLDIVPPNTIDNQAYVDFNHQSARIGYYGRFTYNYAQKYYLEFSGRYDASWKFPPDHRWGFFPAVSAGWRITSEPFFQSLVGESSALTSLKLRMAYGKLGDDNIGTYNSDGVLTSGIGNFAYRPGYNYGEAIYIFDGQGINTSANRGVPYTNFTWFTATNFDVGLDFGFWNGKLSGSLDYFHRKRTGLLGNRYTAIIPELIGYSLPQLNQNSDANVGGEVSLSYRGSSGRSFTYNIRANAGFARKKFLHSFHPTFGNSWDKYRNSQEERWTGIFWGYQVIGRFKSQEQINKYPVNIDEQGNTTLLPGDFIYKDVNGDGVINEYDMRPIGGAGGGFNPMWYGGLQLGFAWKGFDMTANFSFAGRYWFNRNWESRWPFQNNGNLLKAYLDRWHLKDYRDPNSGWIPGKYPALRFNDRSHSNYAKNSDFWLINVRYFRLRTFEVGYTLPQKWTSKAGLEKARVYVNTYNLFSIDNMPSYLDPAVAGENGLQYPPSKFVNIGFNLIF